MGASSAPAFPYPGGVQGAEPADPTPGASGHLAWAVWMKQFTKNLDSQTVKRSGDSMTGSLEFGANSLLFGTAQVRLDYTTVGSVHGIRAVSADGVSYRNISAASPTHSQHLVTKGHMDSTLAALGTGGPPIGSILMWPTATPPAGWLLCNGQITDGYPALAAIVGSTVPDLRDRFIVGAGSGYSVEATGGANEVTLTAAQSGLRDHGHTASSGAETQQHTHTVDPPNTATTVDSHTHGINLREGTGTGDGYYVDTNPTDSGYNKLLTGTSTTSDSHSHNVNIASFTSGGRSASHTHAISVGASGSLSATASHENRPPYYALTYIIRAA